MFASETIHVYSEVSEVFDNEGNVISLIEYDYGEIPVKNRYCVIGTVNKDDLIEILKSTKSIRVLNSPQGYFRDDVILEIDMMTDKGALHIVIGKEKSFWYRDGSSFFRYQILDSQALHDRITGIILSE